MGTILQRWIEDSTLLDRPEDLSEEDRRELFALEEMMAGLFGETLLRAGKIEDEEKFALIVDRMITGGLLPEGTDIKALFGVARALRMMQSELRYPLPEALRGIIARKEKEAPSIYVKLGQAGLTFIKSTLQGFMLQEEAAADVRSAAGTERTSPRVTLLHRQNDGELQYQLVKDSDEFITISMHVPATRGFSRALLKKEGKMIASESMDIRHETVAFDRLSAGSYAIELQGRTPITFSLVVEKTD